MSIKIKILFEQITNTLIYQYSDNQYSYER